LDEYHAFATGGTSGHRAVVVWDFEGFRLAQSRMVGCGLWLERKWQLDLPLPRVAASVGSSNSAHMLGALTRCFSNPNLITIHAIPASAPIEEVVGSLNALQPSALGGYASMLHQLSERALAGELRIEPTVITQGGEPFLPEAWVSVSQAFPRAIVREVWGATEIGIVASSYPGIEGLVLGKDLAIVEPVDAEGRPVAPGERAARLFVTNLANRILPLIRYEITDEATMLPPHPDCPWAGPRLAAIHGRQDDVFTYRDGRRIHPHTFRSVLTRHAGVAEYQVRQTQEGVAVAIHATAAIEMPTLERELARALAAAGLAGARAEVTCVPGIARHAQSQKLKRFIPLS
jgi:phenylacetate-coenzyme A ligase PaaK-like adenylate-forming protein